MSIPGDVFEPVVIRNILKNLQKGASERKLFEKKWEENVCLTSVSKRSPCSLICHCRSSTGWKAGRRTGITSQNTAFNYSGRRWLLNMSITSTTKLLFMAIKVQARHLHLSKRTYLSWAHVSYHLRIII